MSSDDTATSEPEGQGRLGTFAGVFTPSILTILGIILFLRLGFVVGSGGLAQALAVILLANLISVSTSFSLSAIATNFKVRGGGDYYLISRTLGREYGGALGMVLFLAQSVSVAFYAIGFAEGVTALVDVEWLDQRVIAGAALLPLFALAWFGSDWATRFQYGIMVILALALASFVLGAVGAFDGDVLAESWTPAGELSFWALFALFFPAVTGFTQGVSMSGDLRDPGKSLPLGTFAAVGLSMIVYLGCAWLMAGAMPGSELVSGYDAMTRIAAVPVLISVGIFAATFSSALASFLGAPRILQALASDRLFGFLQPFAKGEGASGNPRRAILLCFGIAVATVAVGDLNVVAPVVSMFFLISYGLLNYATYYEARSSSPAFRPRFRWYHSRISLLGCLACAGTMIAIDATAGAVAIAVLFAIYQYLRRSGGNARWTDASRSALFQRVRTSLLEMNETVEHDRDWRPVTLAFSDDPARRKRIVRFASWIEGGSGITTAVRAIEGEGPLARAACAEAEAELRAELQARGLEAFARVVAMRDLESGFPVLLQAAGLGAIRPNIALFNWFDREETAEDVPAMRSFGAFLRTALRHGCNVAVLAARNEAIESLVEKGDGERVLDVWWRRDDASSRLALLLAYLMGRGAPWEGARLRLLVPRVAGTPDEQLLAELRAELEAVRIRAEPVVVADAAWATVATQSTGTALAFVTLRVRTEGLCDTDGELLPGSLEGLPPLVFVQAAQDIDLEAQPDEGEQAEQARKEDALVDARAQAERAREQADALRADAEALANARGAVEEGERPAELEAGEKEVDQAEAAAVAAERKAAKTEANARSLAKELKTEALPESDPT
jgi:amino acid transporter